MKKLAYGLMLSVLLPVAAVPADAILDSLRLSQYDWSCVKVVDGADQFISGHQRQDKAFTRCQIEKLKDMSGQYEVVPGRYRIILTPAAAAQLTLGLTVCSDGSMNTEHPGGDCPSDDTCPNWTSADIGNGKVDVCNEIDADTITITASGINDYSGYGFVYDTQSTADDMQLSMEIPATSAWSGHTENFTGCGVMFREGTGANDYNYFAWRPFGSVVTHKAVENQTLITSGGGEAGTTLPRRVRVWYDHSASTLKAFESSDGVTWSQVGSDVTKTLTFPVVYGPFCTSHDENLSTTVPLDLIAFTNTLDTGGGGPGEPISRTVDWSCNFDTGQFNNRSDGELDCSVAITASEFDGTTLGIANITRANPAIITYTGANPTNGDAFQISGVNGMTEVNGQLVYVQDLNTTAKTFRAAVMNWPIWSGNGSALVASQIATTSIRAAEANYGTYTSGGTLSKFQPISIDSIDRGHGPGTAFKNKIIASGGGDTIGPDTVTCREGSYCFRSHAGYHHANFSNSKNKPRMSLNPATEAQPHYNEPNWHGFSVYVPTNSCEDTGGSQQRIQVHTLSGDSASQTHLTLSISRPTGSGGQIANWVLRHSVNPDGVNSIDGPLVTLAPVTKGKWHDFVFYTVANPTTGILRIWHNEADGGGGPGNTPQMVYETTTGYGNLQSGTKNIGITLRQYYFTWKHQATTCQNPDFYLGFDSAYFGKAVNGTGFADVHPGGQSQP